MHNETLRPKGKEKERVVMRGPNGVGLGLGLELPTGSVRTNSPLRSSFRGEDGRENDVAGRQVREVKEEQIRNLTDRNEELSNRNGKLESDKVSHHFHLFYQTAVRKEKRKI